MSKKNSSVNLKNGFKDYNELSKLSRSTLIYGNLDKNLKPISKNFKNIKINAVLLKNINDSDEEFEKFGNFIRDNKIDFRFIELMQTGLI